jgi:hypothetical protein
MRRSEVSLKKSMRKVRHSWFDLKKLLFRLVAVMADLIPPNVKQFRIAIIPMTIFIFVGSMGIALSGIIFEHGFANVDWYFLMKGCVFFGLPCALLMAVMMCWLYPAGFSADGIYAHSSWGKRRYINWLEIEKVRKFTIFNLRWLRIYSSVSGKVAWLPLFQSRPTEFRNEIQKFAPPDNPLLNHLN